MNDKADDMRAIRNIENKYGLMLFRMGLSHLVDVGHRNFCGEYVEESIRLIMADTDKAGEKAPIISPEFQCEIMRCAGELAGFSPWTLFAYIKKYLVISNSNI